MSHGVIALVDVDGPLADFHGRAKDHINSKFGLNVTDSDFETWDVTAVLPTQAMRDQMNADIAMPGFASSLMPSPGSQDAIESLRSVSKVLFVTTPHPESKTWMRERQDWLAKHFGAKPHDIIHIFDKSHVLGDMLLDDKPSNVELWQKRHPQAAGLLWDMLYNRDVNHLTRVNSWETVLDIVRRIKPGWPVK